MLRQIIIAAAVAVIAPAAQAAAQPAPSAPAPSAPVPSAPAPSTKISKLPTLHVTHTYLRAAPGKRAALIAYIERNWFVMDHIGIEQGLFTSYSLLERADDTAADWDVIVAVGYPTIMGHDAPGTADAFRKIRAAHRETKVDGLGLTELGSIVRHYPLTLAYQGR